MTKHARWGPLNPHPFSQLGTELVWRGKYDEYGRPRTVNAAAMARPMPCVERIDGPDGGAETDGFRNRLIWGDNKAVMAGLLAEFKGSIDLVYVDPPFDAGGNRTVGMTFGEGGVVQDRGQVLDLPAYRDVWGKGVDSYLHMLFERFTLIKEVLAPTGNLFVHVDHRANSAVRFLLDEVFGPNMLNEIIWQYNSGPRGKNIFGKRHDTIFRYALNPRRAFMDKDADAAREPYSPDINVPASKAHYYHPKGKVKGDVWKINILGQNDKTERTGYDTQKPEALLEQIIAVCCPENGLVADFFCGSGTTGAVAERLGRRWIMADLGTLAIHTCRKRLIDVQRTLHANDKPSRGFDIHYLESSEVPPIREASRQTGKGALEVELVRRKARASSAKTDNQETRPRGGLDVRITRFVPPLNNMPDKAAESFRALLDKGDLNAMDFWAVDFDWQPGRPFHHDWQDYHFRRYRAIKMVSEAAYVHAKPGPHTIAVKAIDLFGGESFAVIDINLPSADATV